jgi:hypothetical protein
MTEEKKEELNQEAKDYLMKKSLKNAHELGLLFAATLIIAGVIIGAYAFGQMARTSNDTPEDLKYTGALNETAYKSVDQMYQHEEAASFLSLGMGVVLGGLFVFIAIPEKKIVTRFEELLESGKEIQGANTPKFCPNCGDDLRPKE